MIASSRQPACVLRVRDRTRGFVQRILARYAEGPISWPRLNGVLLRPWIAWMPQAAQSLRIVLAPQVNLAVISAAVGGRHQTETMQRQGPRERMAGLRVRRQQAERWLASTSGERATVGTLLAPPRAALRRTDGEVPVITRALAPVMEVVRRLSARGERIEGGLYHEPLPVGHFVEAGGRWGMRPVVSPVPRVVHRNAGLTASAESQPETAKRADTKTFSSTPGTAPPAIDVERLTSEVVRAIDRRIIAQRERLGRG